MIDQSIAQKDPNQQISADQRSERVAPIIDNLVNQDNENKGDTNNVKSPVPLRKQISKDLKAQKLKAEAIERESEQILEQKEP